MSGTTKQLDAPGEDIASAALHEVLASDPISRPAAEHRAYRETTAPHRHSFTLMTWMLAGSGIRKIGPQQV
jgi:hypothetical protein